MNLQTSSIEITGLSPELLRTIDQRAREAGHTAEEFLRTWIEQAYTELSLSPPQIETLRKEVQLGRDQLAQGQFRTYASADEMMDDIEAEIARRAAQRKNGNT